MNDPGLLSESHARFLHASLSERVRPVCYGDVLGQAGVVSRLREEARLRRGRSVFVCGPEGCGKTALAELYARALLCHEHGAAGSGEACGACPDCEQTASHDHPNWRIWRSPQEDEPALVRAVSDAVASQAWGGWLVVLIEDADRLSARALDTLHHRLERHPVGVTFILTSARPDSLCERVQDLLLPLPVRPLGRDERAELIARVCARERIAAELPAVDRLAALAGGRPRRLLRDLETLTADDRITVEAIDAFYDRSAVGPAALYVTRVLERHPFLKQLEPLDAWEAEPPEKIAGIAATFAALFTAYLSADAWDGRGAVFSQASDGGAVTPAALDERARTLGLTPRAFFAAILDFWHPLPSADAGQLLARTSAFDELLNGPGGRARGKKGLERPVRHRRRAPAVRAYEAPGAGGRRSEEVDRLRPTQVRALWEAGSFLIQRYGVCLNTRISLRHADLACSPEAIGPFVSSLLHELGMRVADRTQAAGSPGILHYLYVHETGSLGGRTHVAAHIPPGTGVLSPWLTRRFADARTGIRLRHWPATSGSEPYRRHLRLMALLCRSCDPEISSPGQSRLVARLGVSPRMRGTIGRNPCAQRCGASRLIGPGARRDAYHGLLPLSVFDDGSWEALASGWEFDEHAYRCEVAAAYEAHRARLDREWPHSNDVLAKARRHAEFERLETEWGQSAPWRCDARPGWATHQTGTILAVPQFPNSRNAIGL